jgi:tetratricopeptide (TPR) repeat protein
MMASSSADRALFLYRQGHLKQACRAFAEILAREPATGEVLRAYGLALRDTGRSGAAVDVLKQAVVIDRDMASMKALAETLHLAGNLPEARQCLEAMLARSPGDPQILRDLGAVAADMGDDERAAALLHEALQAAPEDFAALTLFGGVGLRLGFVEAARAALLKAVAFVPDEFDALVRLADRLCQAEQEAEGLALYDRALALKPRSIPVLGNRGAALLALGRPREALVCLQKANSLQPDTPKVINLLVQAWRNAGDLERAAQYCAQALRLQPNSRNARSHHATLLLDRGRFAESLAAIQALTAELPEDAELERFESLLLLLMGDFKLGWAKMESRMRFGVAGKLGLRVATPWQGEAVDGKRVLITAEEGFGDTIQFIRYASHLAGRGAVVGVRATLALHRLLSGAKGVSELYDYGGAPPDNFDFDIKLLSLPLRFGTTLQTIPAETPYLSVAVADVQRWRARLEQGAADPALPRIGLVWAGNPKHQNDHNRSMAWERLAPLVATQGVSFHGLQVGAGREAFRADPCGVLDLAPELADYYETACCISALDLVMTVDTSVAHLAGALRRPVWTLLPFSPDWRWMLGRDDSPWYPSMRLFRQSAIGDWDGVIARVCRALEACKEQLSLN